MTVGEHAFSPPTKFNADYIPAPPAAFPRCTDTSHRRRYAFLALSCPSTTFYNIFTLFSSSPNSLRGHLCSAYTGWPMREHLLRYYIYTLVSIPAPPLLCFQYLFYILFRIFTPLHPFTFYIQITYKLLYIK